MHAPLLIELLTEELPPKSLARLARAFADALAAGLRGDGLIEDGCPTRWYATPRRLAVALGAVRTVAPDREELVKGPSLRVGRDADGRPTRALLKFAEKRGVDPSALEQVNDGRQDVFAHRARVHGRTLAECLAGHVDDALRQLPVQKLMRWGAGEAQFVRPVHGLVMLHGAEIVPGTVLGLAAGRTTRGHRFLGAGDIALAHAEDYLRRLADDGRVVADFEARRADIEGQLLDQARRLGATLGNYTDLLDEVTALVELPTVYVGAFDPAFLQVPQECLILTMRQNQKYFPLFNSDGALLARFLIVSNMRIPDPRHIVAGNQRVVRPRLEDARFFYTQDLKLRLEARVPDLARMVYHHKLGSLLERVERMQLLAGSIARQLDADAALAERAAWLAKADLLTAMVGEFPELQGVMGRRYALHDGEPGEVAEAIDAHYRPRFAGDTLPAGAVACSVALADRLDTLVGMFAVGGAPTGDKDPFALRRAALGTLRILLEHRLPLPLRALLGEAAAGFDASRVPAWVCTDVFDFMLERLRHHLRDGGHPADEVDAVLALRPERVDRVPSLLGAVRAFRALPEADSLAAANKRIRNILRKAEHEDTAVDAAVLGAPAEHALWDAVTRLAPTVGQALDEERYTDALCALAGVRDTVDRFFDEVMVNADDPGVRRNRLALLRVLERMMNQVADLSRLAA